MFDSVSKKEFLKGLTLRYIRLRLRLRRTLRANGDGNFFVRSVHFYLLLVKIEKVILRLFNLGSVEFFLGY